MAQVSVTIGGRTFEIACEDGQQDHVLAAAGLLDAEASELSGQIGRLSEGRMLLMAGLMLADRYTTLAARTEAAEGEATQLREDVAELMARGPERIEVPVVPREVTDSLSEIAARAEALADDLERSA